MTHGMTPVAPEGTAAARQGRVARAATGTAVEEDQGAMRVHNVVIPKGVETTAPEARGKTSVEAAKVHQPVAWTGIPVQQPPERTPCPPL